MPETAILLMAAGQGTRMRSSYPKVLHPVAGEPMIKHVIRTVNSLNEPDLFIIIGHEGDKVREEAGDEYTYIWQSPQLGTGHAVMQAEDFIHGKYKNVVILSGDVPLLQKETIQGLLSMLKTQELAAVVLTAKVADPYGYGRIVRTPGGMLEAIVEEKDASEEIKKITEINTGIYCFDVSLLFSALKEISPENAQKEYYLTDVLGILVRRQHKVGTLLCPDPQQTLGVNNRIQLAQISSILRQRIMNDLMINGVTIIDPVNTYIDSGVRIGQDTTIYPYTFISGRTIIGQNCVIGPGCRIKDSVIDDMTTIEESVILESHIGEHCRIGPFSYIRPGCDLGRHVKIGDFVELKKVTVADESKIPHLSYVGDATIGKRVNVGAGTITCNYDGVKKHLTSIEDDVFVGSNTNLVAPVIVKHGSIIAAGSTITQNVPEDSLAIARAHQINKLNWRLKNNDKKREEL